jgi:hypothetical protein
MDAAVAVTEFADYVLTRVTDQRPVLQTVYAAATKDDQMAKVMTSKTYFRVRDPRLSKMVYSEQKRDAFVSNLRKRLTKLLRENHSARVDLVRAAQGASKTARKKAKC